MTCPAEQPPHPPAAVYAVVADALESCALGIGYFERPHPQHGVVLVVEGHDRRTTTWYVETKLGARLLNVLRKDPRVRHANGQSYVEPLRTS